MTTTADSAVERAFEAALAGRPVPPGTGGLAAFTEAVRATATQPCRPSPALAELLADGLAVSDPSPLAARPRPGWFSRVLGTVASAGATARVAACAGIAVAALTGAGTAGVLPAGAQHTFAQVVEAATSLRVPDPERTTTADATDGTPTPPASTTPQTPGTPTTGSSSAAPPPPAPSLAPAAPPVPGAAPVPLGYDCDPTRPFGACVSRHRQAADGALTPGQVDEWARYHRAQREAQADPGGTPGTTDSGSNGSAPQPGPGSAGRPNGNGHAGDPPGAGNGPGHR